MATRLLHSTTGAGRAIKAVLASALLATMLAAPAVKADDDDRGRYYGHGHSDGHEYGHGHYKRHHKRHWKRQHRKHHRAHRRHHGHGGHHGHYKRRHHGGHHGGHGRHGGRTVNHYYHYDPAFAVVQGLGLLLKHGY